MTSFRGRKIKVQGHQAA